MVSNSLPPSRSCRRWYRRNANDNAGIGSCDNTKQDTPHISTLSAIAAPFNIRVASKLARLTAGIDTTPHASCITELGELANANADAAVGPTQL